MEDEKQVITHEDGKFKMTIEVEGESLSMVLEGRLDSSTSEGMQAKYLEVSEGKTFSEILVDMENLDYLSSAGLRVLLLMRKKLAQGGSFHMEHMNSVIKEIMDNTGFAEVLV